MPEQTCLSFRNIRKAFPGVLALDDVSLDIRTREIHALLGENGAGKSTLSNILYGLYRQDSGEIYLNGDKLARNSTRNAIQHGIGMIHQHFMLIPVFTVLENIILGLESSRPPMLKPAEFRRRVESVAANYRIKVDLDAAVEDLSVGAQQKVEILKALYRGASLLILDEPTSVLTPQECQDLFAMLFDLRDKGCTIIFISHKLNEVMQISDRISVLRDGRLVQTVNKSDTNPHELSKWMVGRDISSRTEKRPCTPGPLAMQVERLSFENKKGRKILHNIDLQICAGEILGIAGVDNNGQTELAEIISGIRPATQGTLKLFGQDVTRAKTRARIEKGLAYIPAERRIQGLVVDFNIAENFILETFYTAPFTKGLFLDRGYIDQYARDLIAEYDVRTPSASVPVRNLSGGNQQKVIIGRELARTPKFLLVVQPTWGLDIGAIEYVHRRIIQARDHGAAVLLISTELEEVRKLSDRMMVIYEGEIVGQVTPQTSIEEVGLMMAGSLRKEVMGGRTN